ncbi:MAG TPA: hypothetical protein VM053_11865 [Gemmatimonadaceae bacterium]|nr:hypothetical protein [Gemmatimonadaceae bacterium]
MRDFIARQNSERLRQRLSGGWRVREPAAFTRLAKSLIDMALVTGIIARLYRALVLSRSENASGLYLALTFTLGALFLLAMTTVHVSRFPLRDWLWRAPSFAALEGLFEMLVSLLLIWLHRESLGTGAAHFHDWPGMALSTIAWRVITISLFALLLAGVVKWVRYMLLRKEHIAWSDGTVKAGIPGEEFIERRRKQ